MDAAVVIGAAVLGVLVSPYLLRLVVQVPAMATVGYVSDEDLTDHPDRSGSGRCGSSRRRRSSCRRCGGGPVRSWCRSCFLAAVLVVMSLIDLEHFRIPDRIVFPALAMSAGLIVFVSLIEGFDSSSCATP